MNRFHIFHQIVTQANLLSIQSVLNTALSQMAQLFYLEKACYFSTGIGGTQCLAARTSHGELPNPQALIPAGFLQKTLNTQSIQNQKLVLPSASSSKSQGLRRVGRFLGIPISKSKKVVGIGVFERKLSQAKFQAEETELLGDLLGDIEVLLENSRIHEKRNYQFSTLMNEYARSKIQMVSQDPGMLKLFAQIGKVAKVPSTILIKGESGSGKELVARAIYDLSGLKGEYLTINCAGIESNLMKSELFGHTKGSFTGAVKDRSGLFQKAKGGVLFLDEIGEMPLDMQAALLRTLESNEIMPVGSGRIVKVNTRIIAASHRDFKEMISNGLFRNDLYQRLKGITLTIPPLRNRKGDIPLLAYHFMHQYNRQFNLNFHGFSETCMQKLCSYNYEMGNVRELSHKIEHAMVFEDDTRVISETFLDDDQEQQPVVREDLHFDERMREHAKRLLHDAIESCNGNKSQAMKALGLPRTTFYNLLSKYGR